MTMDNPHSGQVHRADSDVGELHDESILEDDVSRPDIDIESFLSQAPQNSRKKQKIMRMKMTQRHESTLSNDAITNLKVSGVIKRVSLKNFMCHANFELEFGPRLNFIIGHNGSGKSSILTAISICLGAKATETNRGSSLRDLIKEGTNVSEVTVVLANDGDEAFDSGTYGKEIIIQRTLRRDAAAFPYKIKSENGRTVSTKKADLDAILDYFNIAVSNPMCFLSQDMARSFLTASSDDQKYKFFMRGTLMESMLENFKNTQVTKANIQDRIGKLKDALLDLKAEAAEARKLHDRLVDSNDLRHKQRIFHGKYYWMEHDYATKLIDQINTTRMDNQEVISELDSKIEEMSYEIEAATEKRKQFQQKAERLTEEINLIKQQHMEKKIDLKKAERKVEQIFNKMNDTNHEIRKLKAKLDHLDRAIQVEKEELRRKNGGSKEVLEQQLQDFKNRLTPYPDQISELVRQMDDIGESYRARFDDLKAEKDQLREQVAYNQRAIKDAENERRTQPNPLDAYGKAIGRIAQDISRSRHFSGPVIGPLGRHVFMKPGFEDFKHLLEMNLGNHLNTFVVQNYNDHKTLQNICREHRHNATILIRRPERFNFSQGRPDSNIMTMLDALEFDNEDVMYTLIDLAHIESMALVRDRQTAQSMLERRTHNVKSALVLNDGSSGFQMNINANGAFLSNPIFYDYRHHEKLGVKGGVTDTSAQKRAVQELQKQMHDFDLQLNDIQSQQKQEKQGLNDEIRKLKTEERRLGAEVYQLEKKLREDADTGKLDAMVEDKEDTERQYNLYIQSIPDMKSEFEDLSAVHEIVKSEMEQIKNEAKRQSSLIDMAGEKLIDSEAEIQVFIQKRDHFSTSKKRRIEELEETVSSLPAWEKKKEDTLNSATNLCTREEADAVPITTMDQLKIEISKITTKVQEADELLGKSPEEIVNDDITARRKYQKAFTQFSDAKSAINLLGSSLDQRLRAFRTSRDSTFIEANLDFTDSLQFRNFTGELNFDTQKDKLQMLVSTKNDKKPRHVDSLSGGEKSFSQIALLLATWKPMRSRIKGLDEFDVFMDQVNRKIGMRLMLSKLSREAKAQTIFITPQDIGQIAELDPRFVQIHRIKDPRAKN